MTKCRMPFLFALSCILALAVAPAYGEDDLMILVEQSPADGDTFKYDFGFSLCKAGATSCTITLGDDSYPCSDWGDCGWFPDSLFWQENGALTFAELQALLANDWIITWDDGLSSETIATVDFGTLVDGFPPMPTITNPPDGADSVSAETSIDWDINPGSVEISYFTVDLYGPGDTHLSSDWVGPTETSWNPGTLLEAGLWTALVGKVHRRSGDVSEDVDIQVGSWNIGQEGWFQYWCIDQSQFTVGTGTPVERTSWGALKAMYRE